VEPKSTKTRVEGKSRPPDLSALALAIQSTNGIQEGMYVKIGGVDQWIQTQLIDHIRPLVF
jgi:hypothetical protein